MIRLRVVDFETTGTEPPARVIEVGRCDVMAGESGLVAVHGPISVLCGGVDAMPAEVRAVHHLGAEDVAGYAPFDAVEFMAQAERDGVTAIVAHNADFEAKWLPESLRRGIPILCTYKAALRAFPGAPSHKNQVLRYWLEERGLTKPAPALAQPAHRAGPDAYATAWTLAALLREASVADMIRWTSEPAALTTCPLGKWRGKPWADVEEGFLVWMLRQATMEADLRWNAQRELDRRRNRGAA